MIPIDMLAQAAELLAWYNAVFVILFGVGMFFTLVQLIGLGGHGGVEAHADADMHADMHADVHADVHADADMDAHAEVHIDTDAGAGPDVHLEGHVEGHVDTVHGPEAGFGSALVQITGMGKIPLSISLMLLGYSIGLVGWASNRMLAPRLESPAAFFPISLLIALVCGLVVHRLIGSFMARYVPTFSSSAMSDKQLVGLFGTATLPINERMGRGAVHDKFGTLHSVQCMVRQGAEPINKGARIVLVRYLPERNMFVVARV